MAWLVGIICLIVLSLLFKGLRYAFWMKEEHAIPLSHIELKNFAIIPPQAFSPRFTATVTNQSPEFVLKSLSLRITVMEYGNGKSEIVGHSDEIIRLEVMPGKTAEINEFVHLPLTCSQAMRFCRYELLYATGI
jgi:hypothetical protein